MPFSLIQYLNLLVKTCDVIFYMSFNSYLVPHANFDIIRSECS